VSDDAAAPSRIPSLDGLRAISISLVLFEHLRGGAGFVPVPPAIGALDYGNFGVRVFFVISGYLISSILFAEMRKRGTPSLAKFYFRRAFRIFPAFYANIAVMVVLASLGYAALRPGDVLHAATYTTNYHHDRAWTLGHTWSLAVEEQFYVLWPVILLLLGKKRGLHAAAGFVLLAPVIRVATRIFHLGPQEGVGETFQTVGDAIAVGCLLAGYRDVLHASRRYLALQESPFFFLVPVLAVLAALTHDHPLVSGALGESTIDVCIALTIDYCIRNARGRIGRVLNWGPLAFVGTLSYSLYLWQQLFMNPRSTAPFAVFPVNLALAFGAALLSYYLVERPFLRWRERLEPRIFRAQRDAAGSAAPSSLGDAGRTAG
jgi:peptidoglycan/LPS O-acetylase OafA/YrhL